jgi:hypothetical protein
MAGEPFDSEIRVRAGGELKQVAEDEDRGVGGADDGDGVCGVSWEELRECGGREGGVEVERFVVGIGCRQVGRDGVGARGEDDEWGLDGAGRRGGELPGLRAALQRRARDAPEMLRYRGVL